MMRKSKVLVLNSFYLPGFKAGGPIRSVSNIVSWLGNEFEFKIITSDRDLNDNKPYDNIKSNTWNNINGRSEDIFYIDPKGPRIRTLFNVLKKTNYDLVYINSIFDFWFSILPLIFLRFFLGMPSSKILIFPRGELSSGALEKGTLKKKVFISLMKRIGLYKNVNWQATNLIEENEIKKIIKINENKIHVVSNLPAMVTLFSKEKAEKTKGKLKLVFISRIAQKKNLSYALEVLSGIISADIVFDIYGVVDDYKYWKQCEKIIANLPTNIHVRYKGSVDHSEIIKILSKYHLFYLPTKGENYGHVIHEAVLAGIPVLISDKTPWLDLKENGAGWSLPLTNSEGFKEVLLYLANLNNEEYKNLTTKVKSYSEKIKPHDKLKKTIKMFKEIDEY